MRTIYQRVRSLKTAPNRGRPGHRSGTREMSLNAAPHVVVYSVKPDAIEIQTYTATLKLGPPVAALV